MRNLKMKKEIQNYIRIEMKSIHEEKKKENSIWNSFADYERDLEKIKMEKDKQSQETWIILFILHMQRIS